MRQIFRLVPIVAIVVVAAIAGARAQQSPSVESPMSPMQVAQAPVTVPPLVPIAGVLLDSAGNALTGPVNVVLAIYSAVEGGAPLWTETQTVQADQRGRYNLTLGATSTGGIPVEIFASPGFRWLGVTPLGQVELARTPILSVAYAIKAADADTLGGKPSSAFVLAQPRGGSNVDASGASANTDTTSSAVTTAAPTPGPSGGVTATQFTSTNASGPSFISQATSGAPLQVSSAALNVNLNADLLDGFHAAAFPQLATANLFSANQTINGSLTVNGSGTAPWANFSGTTGADGGGVPIPLVRMVQGGAGNALFVENTQDGFGHALWARAVNFPIQATVTSGSGIGVRADATSPVGQTNGVLGVAFSTAGFGVRGDAIASSGSTKGVLGQSSSTTGVGVEGVATAASGATAGVRGLASSAAGTAGLFDNLAAGNLLVGQANSVTKFRVDGAGAVYASSFHDLAGNPINSGTVTSVGTGTGLTGGPITSAGTLALDTSFTDARYAPIVHGHDVSQIANAASLGSNTFIGTETIDLGNLDLDPSTATAGSITKNGQRFLHNFGADNTFLGLNAGNFNLSGNGANTGIGASALRANSTGSYNTAIGGSVLLGNTTGNNNTGIGYGSLYNNIQGFDNTAAGVDALLANTNGGTNTAYGAFALENNSTGNGNTALGREALVQNQTGNYNVAVGRNAGANADGSNNIYLGAAVSGTAGESNAMYLGNTNPAAGSLITKTVIAGIRGTTLTDGEAVVIDTNGRLGIGSVSPGANTVGSAQVTDESLTASDLAPNSVGSSELAADSVTADKVAFNYAGSTSEGGPAIDLVCVGCVSPSEVSFSFASLGANSFIGPQTIDSGNVDLDPSTASAGNLTKNGTRFLHNFGTQNLFGGVAAGNFALTGAQNTAFGEQALTSLTTGGQNTAVGQAALYSNTSGASNTAIGNQALASNTTGGSNTVVGRESMVSNTTGNANTALGHNTLTSNVDGANNTALGMAALRLNMSGGANTGVGTSALPSNSTGQQNTAVGAQALLQNTTGNNNVALGTAAGANATTGMNNIYLGAFVQGVAGESNAIYIGNQGTHNKTIIAGIRGTTVSGGDAVLIDANGRLGSGSVTPSANSVGSAQVIDESLTAGDLASGSVTTSELAADSVTADKVAFNYAASIGEAGPALDLVCIGCVSASEVGFTFAGLGANTFGASQTINSGNLDLDPSTSTAGNLTKDGQLFLHNFGTNNTFLGVSAGNLVMTGGSNTALGVSALGNNSAGGGNTATGYFALGSNTTGGANVAIGTNALHGNTTGYENAAIGLNALFNNSVAGVNTAVGINALFNNTGGSNVAVGRGAGLNATTGFSNIYLGTDVNGLAGESNTMYLGKQGTQTKTFIAGIRGITTVNPDAIPVMIDSAGQLGTVSSSRRFKEDIRDMADASRRLFQLRPVAFRYKQAYGDGTRPIHYGLIAEEVAQAFPELAVRSADGSVETVHYETLSVLLLNEMQSQERRLREQHHELERQQQRIDALEQQLKDLAASVSKRR